MIDATGAEVCIQTGLYLLGHGGTHVQVGMGNDSIQIPISTLLNKEIAMKGSFRYRNGCYALAVDLVARAQVDLAPLITHRFAFRDALVAFESNQAGVGPDGKPLIKAVIDGPVDGETYPTGKL